MLKVTVFDSATESRLMVEGTLVGPWVTELESIWRKTREARDGRRIVIDLSETTVIDPNGKRILMAMASQGAELVAKGVYMEYVVKGLVDKVNASCRF